jgi:hypothetical protein
MTGDSLIPIQTVTSPLRMMPRHIYETDQGYAPLSYRIKHATDADRDSGPVHRSKSAVSRDGSSLWADFNRQLADLVAREMVRVTGNPLWLKRPWGDRKAGPVFRPIDRHANIKD